MQTTVFSTTSVDETIRLGTLIGERFRGGELIELKSDLGGGKTTFTRGLAEGFGSENPVTSPSFTINNVYGKTDGSQLWHFDFYRLSEPGIIANELAEAQADDTAVIVVEWGEIVHDILADDHIVVTIISIDDTKREITIEYPDSKKYLVEGITP